ncbi:alpha/beta fold hydrolase [Polyangium jinanense]|uniref:Alpha/beta hydrolase n=1 Tax=Polyangium jinanense TaxID=2829994 RepID=A0A9X3XI79_9BACT|nr:alpha/beta hydrolase [Polyangium jinanense]MDC3961818.1 alpha/beta hydrolase [Polyangium jinanense]MDC3988546.1 alpha/beta hydrolase [Polyangium jinanense]
MLPPRLPLAVETRAVTAPDGTRITYYATRSPYPGAPVVLLANGLGGQHITWSAQIEHLRGRYRFLTWDYRGLFASARPPEGSPASYAITRHAEDLLAILDAEGEPRAALVGWSMGVQVVLEAYRKARHRARCIVLLNGTSGRPLDTVSPLPGMKTVLPSLVEFGSRVHALASQVTRRAADVPEALGWLKAMGVMNESLDDAVFNELVQGFSALDMEAYFHNLRALGDHDASDVLGTIDVPTLIVTGDRDAMTPASLAKEMAKQIPGAELYVVRGGTHYTAVEFPELVSLRLEKFLAKAAPGAGGTTID